MLLYGRPDLQAVSTYKAVTHTHKYFKLQAVCTAARLWPMTGGCQAKQDKTTSDCGSTEAAARPLGQSGRARRGKSKCRFDSRKMSIHLHVSRTQRSDSAARHQLATQARVRTANIDITLLRPADSAQAVLKDLRLNTLTHFAEARNL